MKLCERVKYCFQKLLETSGDLSLIEIRQKVDDLVASTDPETRWASLLPFIASCLPHFNQTRLFSVKKRVHSESATKPGRSPNTPGTTSEGSESRCAFALIVRHYLPVFFQL